MSPPCVAPRAVCRPGTPLERQMKSPREIPRFRPSDRTTQCPAGCPPIGGHSAGHCVGRCVGREGEFSRGLFVWRPGGVPGRHTARGATQGGDTGAHGGKRAPKLPTQSILWFTPKYLIQLSFGVLLSRKLDYFRILVLWRCKLPRNSDGGNPPDRAGGGPCGAAGARIFALFPHSGTLVL